MPDQKFVRPERVALAIRNLAEWRGRAKSQAAMHLWPLLAIVHAKVGKTALAHYEHSDEFAFWNAFFRLPGDDRPDKDDDDNFTQDYYLDPLVLALKPSDYPHRGPWTIRVRTFLASWKAAESEDDNTRWKLKPNYADIVVDKVLTRGDDTHRVPVVDLAAWLFRERPFPANADATALERLFRKEFPFENTDYQKIFEFVAEKAENIFQPEEPTAEKLTAEMTSVLVKDEPTPPEPPPLLTPAFKSLIDDDHELLVKVKELLEANSSGIIFRGCPGTSKTWYAMQIAHRLVKDPAHVFLCQFHPSLGYEDFVEGYVPDEETTSGFRIVDKIFMQACTAAAGVESNVVLVIDEINRGDPARVLGELLTYIEHGYRGVKFKKTYSQLEAVVPKNLIVFGTMNQHDRSITQFDLALIRRFDHVDLHPSAEQVERFLTEGEGFTAEQIERVVKWFEALQRLLPFGIGHTYFKDAKRPDLLQVVWRYRMLPYCEAVLELHQDKLDNVRRSFDGMYAEVTGHETQA